MRPEEIEKLPYRRNVGVMLVNDAGNVFVAQRIDSDGPAWQMSQGGIDGDETPRQAALRELQEETGIGPDLVRIEAEMPDWVTYDLPHDLVGKIWKGRYRGQKQKWVLMRYLGRDSDIDIATEHPEFTRWRWLPPEELPEVIVPFKRHVYERIVAQFRDLL